MRRAGPGAALTSAIVAVLRPDPAGEGRADRPRPRSHHPAVRLAPVLPAVDRPGRSRPPATGSASRAIIVLAGRGSAARCRRRGGRHLDRAGRPHRARVLLRSAGRGARRSVGSQAGDDRLRPRSGHGDRLPALRAQPGRPGGWRRCCSRRFTLLWSPAKDATVPKLVPPSHLASANSLSLAAAYGTFPFAALLFAILAGGVGLARRRWASHHAWRPTRWRWRSTWTPPPSWSPPLLVQPPRHRRPPRPAATTRRTRAMGSRPDPGRAARGMAVHLHQPDGAGREPGSGHRPGRRRHAHPARGASTPPTCCTPVRPATGCSPPRSGSAWPWGRSGWRCFSGACPRSGCSPAACWWPGTPLFVARPAPGRWSMAASAGRAHGRGGRARSTW